LQHGDMYEYIRDVELTLHRRIKEELSRNYGAAGWWQKGVPLEIRKACVSVREEDDEPIDDPFCSSNLIHLKKILESEWPLFLKTLPAKLRDKKQLTSSLGRLNRIRNAVMHPVKGKQLTEDDFCFVRTFRAELHSG
jgi:hypothetical protein